ncbi:uncharacterized protein LOC131214253 [Anopheles bellator]|uniref:uncharacterized protein LOC131214253 n=1 Tax=Anopheles bellator TaxID=139047 RepID=UPI0026476285|nr:uncharacterized protein LOC131214253 [Anopheles bellator]
MKFLQIDDPRDTLPISCRLLHLFGLGRDERFKWLFWFQCLLYLVFNIITRFIMDIEDTVTLVRLGAETLFVTSLFAQMLALYVRRVNLYDLIDMLRECTREPCSDEISTFFVRTNGALNKFSIAYCRYFMVVFILYQTMPPIATWVVYLRNRSKQNETPEEYIIPTEMK